jgi:hypothetical protein
MDPRSYCPRLLLSLSPRRHPLALCPSLATVHVCRSSKPGFFIIYYSPCFLVLYKYCLSSWASCNPAVWTGSTSDFDRIKTLDSAAPLSTPLVAHFHL